VKPQRLFHQVQPILSSVMCTDVHENESMTLNLIHFYVKFHRSAVSWNLPPGTGHDQDLYLKLPDLISIGLKTSPELLHPFEKTPAKFPESR
jgi:hypothetical protein